MRKANLCYEQSINKREGVPNQKVKRTNNFEQRIKIFKSNKNFRNNSRNYPKNTYQGTNFKSNTQHNFTAAKNRDIPKNHVKNSEEREFIKWWKCQAPHYVKQCTNRKRNFSNVHTEKEIPKINAKFGESIG